MHLIFAVSAAIAAPAAPAAPADYQALLEADRGWSARAAQTNMVDGLAQMFDADAVLVSGGRPDLVRGRDAIRARLAARPENLTSKVEWVPVSGGISADGTQGYTYGSMSVRPTDGPVIAQKYLAYWVKRPDGWRVLAYKRAGRREAGDLNVAPTVMGKDRRSDDALATLKQAERAFSDEAQVIGLRAAFKKWGRAESVNIGAEDAVAVGSDAVGNGIAGPEPGSPVTWAADEAVVAPSGDMGLTYGLLHAKNAPAGQPATIPFFTVWARPKASDPWRYVAE